METTQIRSSGLDKKFLSLIENICSDEISNYLLKTSEISLVNEIFKEFRRFYSSRDIRTYSIQIPLVKYTVVDSVFSGLKSYSRQAQLTKSIYFFLITLSVKLLWSRAVGEKIIVRNYGG
jgi:hypothetical protein